MRVCACDTIYENERSGLFGGFSAENLQESDLSNWTDAHEQSCTKDTYPLADGWEWSGPWQVDLDNGNCDADGWQVCLRADSPDLSLAFSHIHPLPTRHTHTLAMRHACFPLILAHVRVQ